MAAKKRGKSRKEMDKSSLAVAVTMQMEGRSIAKISTRSVALTWARLSYEKFYLRPAELLCQRLGLDPDELEPGESISRKAWVAVNVIALAALENRAINIAIKEFEDRLEQVKETQLNFLLEDVLYDPWGSD